ncbi:hypothetical protein ACEN2Y_08310 (plasmid) [Ralstonia solanacearum]|uniref:hypothetical protein n=1 Tax=Ralstonia solanacearum TaxID=305 RepID=UPI0032164411
MTELALSALEPVLQSLYDRLDAAHRTSPSGNVPLNETTLGTDGSAILAVLPEAFVTASVTFLGDGLTLDSDPVAQTVTLAGTCSGGALGLDQPGLHAVFGLDAATGALVMTMTIGADDGWSLDQTFPLLAQTWFSTIRYVQDTTPPPCLVLTSLADAQRRYAKGLNVRGSLQTAQWPLNALPQLISSVSPTLQTTGSAQSLHSDQQSVESLVITTPLPDFSLPATILPALDFRANLLALYAKYTVAADQQDLVTDQSIDLCAQSEVTVNGVALPLAVYLPVPGAGWGVGLVPGARVPIGQLADFLTGFAGVSLGAALPDAVRALNVFELRTMLVRLNPDRTSFSSFSLALGTVPADTSGSVWKIIDGVIELHALDFDLNVVRNKQGVLQTSGLIQGAVNLGSSLQVGANIALPIGQGPWTFSARSTQPINALDAIGGLFGSNNLAQSLPAGLGALASYVLQNLSFTFDPAQGQLTRANLAIATAQPWAIVADQLVLESLYLDLTVDHPRQTGIAPYGEVGGALQIGSVHLAAQVTCDGPGSPWLITVSATPVPLPSLAEMTRLLAGQRVADALPDTLAGNGFSLFGVSVSANLTTRKVQQVTFGLTTTGSWTVIADILVVNGVQTYFEFDWTGTDDALAITGYISGSVAFLGANFMLSATKRAGGWDLSAQLDTSTPFTLQNGITRFGSADLWNSVAALGVPNVSITRGGIAYATDTRDYALQATVDFSDPGQNLPWTVSIGITTLTIRSLGADITAVRASDGTAGNKKICVTGAFDIGSVGFNVLYDTSKGVVIDCTLVSADHPVSARDIARSLLGDNAVTGIAYTSGFMPLDQILFSDVHAQLVVGTGSNTSSFQLYGTITVQGTRVNAVLAIQRDAAVGWGFVVGIKVDSHWNLPGFTDVLGSFNFDKQTWLVAVSSFNSPNFAYPAAFNLPDYKGALKYLNFYASFSTANTDPAVGGVTKLLPSKTLPPSLTVTGLVADKLADSWLKCTLYTDADGVPIFGWDTMRLISVDFVISGKPALALQAVFLYKGIYNVDPNTQQKSYLRLQLSTGVTSTYAFIIASGVNGQPIFTWNDALGLDGLTLQLDWVKLGLVFTGLGIEGGFEGMVSFSNPPRQDTVPTLMRNVRPHPAEVARTRSRMRRMRAVRACGPITLDAGNPAIPGVPTDLTAFCAEHQPPVDDAAYERAFDPDQIMVKMLAVVAVTAASEGVPVPRQLGAHIVNVTIPYLLKQFVNIDVPSIIQPIQLPDVCFYIAIGDSPSVFEFYFHGVIVIFYWRGEVEALFQLPHIRFSARMDPVLIGPSANDPLIVLAKASNDLAHGPDILVDSQPPSGQPMIRGHLYCSFLKIFNFEADIEVSAGPPPLIHFSVAQNLGSLLNYHLTFTYRDLLYIHADGGFSINLSTQQGADNISGFSVTKNGQPYRMANRIDLTRVQTATANAVGLMMAANTVFTLDASPNHPVFQLQFRGDFEVDLGARCHIACHLNFDYSVDSNTLENLPAIIISQLGSNAAQVFGALVQTAECFAWFLEQGLLILQDAADAARALVGVFAVAIDRFVDLLNTLGNGLDTLSDWLWDIFGSHDSEHNTRALRDNTDNRYSSSQVASAVKQTQDTNQPSNPYTARALMRDQANAGYSSSDALRALTHVFSQYAPGDMAVAAGRLAADPTLTSYPPRRGGRGAQGELRQRGRHRRPDADRAGAGLYRRRVPERAADGQRAGRGRLPDGRRGEGAARQLRIGRAHGRRDGGHPDPGVPERPARAGRAGRRPRPVLRRAAGCQDGIRSFPADVRGPAGRDGHDADRRLHRRRQAADRAGPAERAGRLRLHRGAIRAGGAPALPAADGDRAGDGRAAAAGLDHAAGRRHDRRPGGMPVRCNRHRPGAAAVLRRGCRHTAADGGAVRRAWRGPGANGQGAQGAVQRRHRRCLGHGCAAQRGLHQPAPDRAGDGRRAGRRTLCAGGIRAGPEERLSHGHSHRRADGRDSPRRLRRHRAERRDHGPGAGGVAVCRNGHGRRPAHRLPHRKPDRCAAGRPAQERALPRGGQRGGAAPILPARHAARQSARARAGGRGLCAERCGAGAQVRLSDRSRNGRANVRPPERGLHPAGAHGGNHGRGACRVAVPARRGRAHPEDALCRRNRNRRRHACAAQWRLPGAGTDRADHGRSARGLVLRRRRCRAAAAHPLPGGRGNRAQAGRHAENRLPGAGAGRLPRRAGACRLLCVRQCGGHAGPVSTVARGESLCRRAGCGLYRAGGAQWPADRRRPRVGGLRRGGAKQGHPRRPREHLRGPDGGLPDRAVRYKDGPGPEHGRQQPAGGRCTERGGHQDRGGGRLGQR